MLRKIAEAALVIVYCLIVALPALAAEKPPSALVPDSSIVYAEMNLEQLLAAGSLRTWSRAISGFRENLRALPVLQRLWESTPGRADSYVATAKRDLLPLLRAAGPRVGLASWHRETASGELAYALVLQAQNLEKLDSVVVAALKERALATVPGEAIPGVSKHLDLKGKDLAILEGDGWLACVSPSGAASEFAAIAAGDAGRSLWSLPAYQQAIAGLPRNAVLLLYVSGDLSYARLHGVADALKGTPYPPTSLNLNLNRPIALATTFRLARSGGKLSLVAGGVMDMETLGRLTNTGMAGITPFALDLRKGTQDQLAKMPQSQQECKQHVALLARALKEYAADNGGLYPDTASWVEAVRPYLKDAGAFKCPLEDASEGGASYAMNLALSGKPLPKGADPARVVLVYEEARTLDEAPLAILQKYRETLAFCEACRHAGYGFADGHAELLAHPPVDLVPTPGRPPCDCEAAAMATAAVALAGPQPGIPAAGPPGEVKSAKQMPAIDRPLSRLVPGSASYYGELNLDEVHRRTSSALWSGGGAAFRGSLGAWPALSHVLNTAALFQIVWDDLEQAWLAVLEASGSSNRAGWVVWPSEISDGKDPAGAFVLRSKPGESIDALVTLVVTRLSGREGPSPGEPISGIGKHLEVRLGNGDWGILEGNGWTALVFPSSAAAEFASVATGDGSRSLYTLPAYHQALEGLPRDAVLLQYVSGDVAERQLYDIADALEYTPYMPTSWGVDPSRAFGWATDFRISEQNGKPFLSVECAVGVEALGHLANMAFAALIVDALQKRQDAQAQETKQASEARPASPPAEAEHPEAGVTSPPAPGGGETPAPGTSAPSGIISGEAKPANTNATNDLAPSSRGGLYEIYPVASVSVNSTDGSCWMADTEHNQVVHRLVHSSASRRIGRVGDFSQPWSVSANSTDGSCWVADTAHNQVVHLSANGVELFRGGGFSLPFSVSVNPSDGSCWVADTGSSKVVHLSASGIHVWRGRQFSQPRSVSVNPADGSCWVADWGNGQVAHLSASGVELWRGGEFASPWSVSVNPADGSCWVANLGSDQVVHLSATGTELWRGGGFDSPCSVSVNQTDGSCWVADYRNNQVVHLSASGAELARDGGFSYPTAVATNSADGSCWVADASRRQVVHLSK